MSRKRDTWASFRLCFYVAVLAALAYMVVMMSGCTPKVPVDTNGDRQPDTEMSWDQLEAWRAQDKAATEAAAKRVARDAQRAIRATDSANVQAIEQIKADAEDTIEGLSLDLTARDSVRDAAIADLERQASIVSGIVNDPTLRGLVGTLPGGDAILGLGGLVLGGIFGNARGKARGKDEGWQEREDYQSKIDATWEEGNARAAK
jgi:hypothetical protein